MWPTDSSAVPSKILKFAKLGPKWPTDSSYSPTRISKSTGLDHSGQCLCASGISDACGGSAMGRGKEPGVTTTLFEVAWGTVHGGLV